ncbi:ABC transporter substrate-binding protein [Gracilibacillus kekensis]|uniref:Carbohydrate ABC transporter substrate-binding protein, CUT1 family n=1 Tax=Gracilibacillus kekensis TaxID=1027249 RepID=A0A1M7KL54_9BACI|nr:ABC transporter substrate-binding protein [Gracilibacillus kekensis]SHM66146.1 carbohydrate ABC transporter substrate-binding protein, CUT1 family [Gracilibacillus kekensis]
MKTYVKSFLFITILSVLLIGCSSDDSSNESGSNDGGDEGSGEVTLSLYSTVTNESDQAAMESVIKKFEEEHSDINIDYNFPAGEYESQLRVKMAANDMPDLFDTHGWAKNRYGEYTMDLSDMDWVENLDPSLETIFTDEEGKVYAYPINQAKDGLTYNKNILDEYGVEPPETFDEFMTALETIKEESDGEVTPFWFAGSEFGAFGQYFDQFATPLLITHPDHDYSEELLDGSFDWEPYTFLPEKLLEMQEKELLNVDALTAQVHEQTQLFAQGKIAFVMATVPINAVQELNPDTELGVMPVPAIHEGGEQSWIGGERHTMAVWKDSEHPEEAKAFIEFISQPDIVKELAEGTALPAGLTNASADIYYQPYYDEYSDVMVEPYFDRVFLPSGMWEPMGTAGQELLSGSLDPEGVSEKMKDEYTRLLEQEASE